MSDKNIVVTEETKIRGIHIKEGLNFLKFRLVSLIISALVIGAGIAAYFVTGGFKLGIDFLGGARVEAHIDNDTVDVASVRSLFSESGKDSEVTTIGADEDKNFLITVSAKGGNVTKDDVEQIVVRLNTEYGVSNVQKLGSMMVGPKMGATFAKRALQLMLIVAGMILVYVALRFDFFYGAGAIVALFHDMLIMFSFALFFQVRLDITIVAALLTILGYSINDSIVVFDRVRENHKLNPDEDYEHTMNQSITQSLSRTIITSITTLFVAIAIYIWGGYVLRNFGLMMIVGIVSGTYSSIFVASPITFILKKWLDKKIRIAGRVVVEKKGKKQKA